MPRSSGSAPPTTERTCQGGHAPLQTAMPSGQLVGLQPAIVHRASGSVHSTMHSPEPRQSTSQSPAQTTSQPPEPGQSTKLPSPTVTMHAPEPVHPTSQSAPHAKSQLPDPAHCKLQSAMQSTTQSPVPGQTQSAPEHSTS